MPMNTRITNTINVADLYGKGYSVFRLDPQFRRQVRAHLDSANWEAKQKGELRLKEINAPAIETFLQFASNWLDVSPAIAPIKRMYGYTISFLDIWDGSGDPVWHWDGLDEGEIKILMYFSRSFPWKEEWGGHLEVARRDIINRAEWMSVTDEDTILDAIKIPPNEGIIVALNNNNPCFIHRAEPFNPDYYKERKAIALGLKLTPHLEIQTGILNPQS